MYEKMKKSCEDFANELKTQKVLKTNNPIWEVEHFVYFKTNITLPLESIKIRFSLRKKNNGTGFFRIETMTGSSEGLILESETAKEAAAEVIEKYRFATQKLLDVLMSTNITQP